MWLVLEVGAEHIPILRASQLSREQPPRTLEQLGAFRSDSSRVGPLSRGHRVKVQHHEQAVLAEVGDELLQHSKVRQANVCFVLLRVVDAATLRADTHECGLRAATEERLCELGRHAARGGVRREQRVHSERHTNRVEPVRTQPCGAAPHTHLAETSDLTGAAVEPKPRHALNPQGRPLSRCSKGIGEDPAALRPIVGGQRSAISSAREEREEK
mmetsp:Transcript_49366/g.122667  ORF Transcript_49366/g.122667 Transcript_49366/m.122667 type:complete len:214 (+) Transcript_49366:670-1311(+)